MQHFENIIGIVEDPAHLVAIESAVESFKISGLWTTEHPGWYGDSCEARAASNACLDLVDMGIDVSASAIIWKAGRFPRHNEQGPFWFYQAHGAALMGALNA